LNVSLEVLRVALDISLLVEQLLLKTIGIFRGEECYLPYSTIENFLFDPSFLFCAGYHKSSDTPQLRISTLSNKPHLKSFLQISLPGMSPHGLDRRIFAEKQNN